MEVKLIWSTPDIDKQIAYIARVSNPSNQDNPDISKLLNYMIKHGHVSPFEMANVCLEITTTRDIARQILRHRSFSFQEFSQRYASVDDLPRIEMRECRMQDHSNRQNSTPCADERIAQYWNIKQAKVFDAALDGYRSALKCGIAKEVARALLPEGLTTTRMYMNGTMRSWIFYLMQRLDPSTQKEHRDIANEVLATLREIAPVTISAIDFHNHHA